MSWPIRLLLVGVILGLLGAGLLDGSHAGPLGYEIHLPAWAALLGLILSIAIVAEYVVREIQLKRRTASLAEKVAEVEAGQNPPDAGC